MNNMDNFKMSMPEDFHSMPSQEQVPMVALMDKSSCMLKDALEMVGKINQQMFGVCELKKENPGECKCFHDVIEQHTKNLGALCEMLQMMMNGLGV